MKLDDRGYALVVALWIVVVLSAIGLEWSLRARSRGIAAANLREGAQAQAAAAAGLEHARARLESRLRATQTSLSPTSEMRTDPWAMPQLLLPDTGRMLEARYTVSAHDAGSRLNINSVDETALRRFLLALEIDASVADRIAQTILDWRDADQVRRARGAELDDYLADGSPSVPADGPFRSISELRRVRGMTDSLYARISPYLTLAGSGRVNLNAADRPVLLTLPGMSEEAVQVLMDLRLRSRRVESLEDLLRRLSPSARATLMAAYPVLVTWMAMATDEVEIEAEGWVPRSPIRSRQRALFVRSGSEAHLLQVDW